MRAPINHRGARPTPVQRDAMRKLATTRPRAIEEVPVVRWDDTDGKFISVPLKSAMTTLSVWRIWNWLLRRKK